jgi:hypothetical protein
MSKKFSRSNLIPTLVILFVLAAVLFTQFSAIQSVRGQAQTCDPAAGPCPTDTPGPTCGLPGQPDCPSNPPPSNPPASNPPTKTPRPRQLPTRTPSPTASATLPDGCFRVSSNSSSSVNVNTVVICTPTVVPATATLPAGCYQVLSTNGGSTVVCTPTPVGNPQSGGLGGSGPTAPNSTAPISPFLLLGVAGGIIVVCIFGLGLWIVRRDRLGGMGDGSAKVELNPQPLPPGSKGGMGEGSNQFLKIEVDPGPINDVGKQFQKADDQFLKFE